MNPDVLEEIKEWIAMFKAERIRLGLSQQALARKMKVGQSNISMWEAGKVYPTAVFFFCWAQALGYDMRPVRRVRRGR